MIEPLALISEKDVESHPELPVLAALETALDMTLLALSTWLPEISDPNYDDSRAPDLRAARYLCARIDLLRRTARHYRESIAIFDDKEHPFATHQPRPEDRDETDF
jgi:hypothetical protein